MAADRFTQISNNLFRDPRISFKAKGLFGYISTHRDGFGVTVEMIVRAGVEGRAAVMAGLKELEAFGYLVRERERREDGTLGAMAYFITDEPAEPGLLAADEPEFVRNPSSPPTFDNRTLAAETEKAWSEPKYGYPTVAEPTVGEPTLGDPQTKNTSSKNTKRENTSQSVSAPASDAAASAPAGADCLTEDPDRGLWALLSAGAGLLAELEWPRVGLAPEVVSPQVIRQHHHLVQALLDAGWDHDRLAARLTRETSSPKVLDRMAVLIHAVRALAGVPPERAVARAELRPPTDVTPVPPPVSERLAEYGRNPASEQVRQRYRTGWKNLPKTVELSTASM